MRAIDFPDYNDVIWRVAILIVRRLFFQETRSNEFEVLCVEISTSCHFHAMKTVSVLRSAANEKVVGLRVKKFVNGDENIVDRLYDHLTHGDDWSSMIGCVICPYGPLKLVGDWVDRQMGVHRSHDRRTLVEDRILTKMICDCQWRGCCRS